MRKILAFLLSLTLMVTLFVGSVTCSAVETIEPGEVTSMLRETFADDLKGEFTEKDDGYIGIPVVLSTFVRSGSLKATILYVVGHKEERIGTDTDQDIINDLLDEGYIVTVLDYLDNPYAVGTPLSYSIMTLQSGNVNAQKYTAGYPMEHMHTYMLPAGCRIARKVYYYSLDTMALNGTNEYIVDIYNTYFAGVKTDNNGNLLPTATSVYDCMNKDGNPIYTDLDMDIIYPANPKEGAIVPVMAFASSSETRYHLVNRRTGTAVYYAGALMQGYAAVQYDHEFTPMCRNDHYGYDLRFFSLAYQNANAVHSAAIRRIRYLADTYGYDAEYLGVVGFSKSSTGPAILADKNHEERGELDNFAEYCSEGVDPNGYQGEQPWLYYEGTNERISSNVTVAYSGAGPGVCNFGSININDNCVPFASSIGSVDTTGGFYTYIDRVRSQFDAANCESLFIEAMGLAHTIAWQYNNEYQADNVDILWTFMDNHIRAAYREEAPEVLFMTPQSGVLYETAQDVMLKFSRAMDVESVKENVKVIRASDGKEITGTWTTLHSDTSFYFNSAQLINGAAYTVEVPAGVKAKDGVATDIPFIKTFKVAGDELIESTADTYVSSAMPDENYGNSTQASVVLTNDSENRTLFAFSRENGFADVSKAYLVLNKTDIQGGSVAVYGKNGTFDENTATWNNVSDSDYSYICSVGGDNEAVSIDVTEYIKGNTSEDISFLLKATSKQGVVYSNDFSTTDSSNFCLNSEYVWGSGGATMNFTENGEIYITGRSNGNRLKFVGSLGKNTLDQSDVASTYKITARVKSDANSNILVGLYAQTGTVGYNPYGYDYYQTKAGQWTTIEHTVTIDDTMVELNTSCVTFVPQDAGNYYIDEITVEAVGSGGTFVTKEYTNEDKLSPTLVLWTPENAQRTAEAAVIGSGKDQSTVLDEELTVNGTAQEDISGTKKGYIKVPITDFDTTKETVTFDFKLAGAAKNTVSIYGIKEDSTEFAQSFDGNITWETAYANDTSGAGVDLSKVYGGAPIATVDTSANTNISVDVKDYVTYMAEKGYTAVTFILVAEERTTITKVDFEGFDSYDTIAQSTNMNGYAHGIIKDPDGGENDVFYFDKSGSQSLNNGYNQAVSFTSLIKTDNKFTEEDIGDTYKVSFKQYNVVEGYDVYGVYGNIAVAGSTNYTVPSFVKRTFYADGKEVNSSNAPANGWFEVVYTITVTEDAVANYSDYTSIIVASGWRATRIYVDDITVEKICDIAPVIIDGSSETVSVNDFEGIEKYTAFSTSSQLNGYEVGLKADPKNQDNTAFYVEKSGKDGSDGTANGYFQAVYLTGLIKPGGTFTSDDVGKTFTVKYKQYIVFTADDRTVYSIYDSIAQEGYSSHTVLPEYITGKYYYNGSQLSGRSDIPTNDWFEVEMSFTVQSDMVGDTDAPLCLVLASGWRAAGVYVDDITVTSENITAQADKPSIVYNGEQKEEFAAAAVIDGGSTDKNGKTDTGNIALSRTAFQGADGYRKVYANIEKDKLDHILTAVLNIKVTDPIIGNTLYVYGVEKELDISSITWKNAYANVSADSDVAKDTVYSGEPIATVTLTDATEYSVDITAFAKAIEKNDIMSIIIVPKEGEGVTAISGISADLQVNSYDESPSSAEIIAAEATAHSEGKTCIYAKTFYSVEKTVSKAQFYIDGQLYETNVQYGGDVHYMYAHGLSAGEHTAYVTFSYTDGTFATSEEFAFTVEENTKMGDVNADGNVDTTDLALLKKYLADKENPDANKVVNGNVDGEGEIDTTDLAILKKLLANIY